MIDIYFEQNYGKLYEKIENGKSDIFQFNNELGSIKYIFLKRKIPTDTIDDYYDIVSPYGYGGPIIINYTEGKKSDLFS